MSGPARDEPAEPLGPVSRVLIVLGSIGLAGAMVTDGAAVAGRHLHVPLVGSIEISQAFVIIMASSAIAFCTLGGDHAAVDLLYSRMPESWRKALSRVNAFLGFAFLAALAFGSAWIALEHWDTGEQTELIHVPLRWFRLFLILAAIISAFAFARVIFARKPKID